MALFSIEEKYRVARILGYPEFDRLNEAVEIALDKIIDQGRYTRAIQIMNLLDTFDERILQSASKGNVIKVDTIELDYSKGLMQIKSEASRLLLELAWLLGLDIQFNKFTGQVMSSGGNSQYSVRSLC